MVEIGTQGKFIELEQDDITRRFFVPPLAELEGRIQALIKGKKNISLVRIGNATIASKDEMNLFTDGVEGIPSKVDESYVVDFGGDHPILSNGPARYSAELVKALTDIEPKPVKEEQVEKGQMSIYDFTAKVDEAPKEELTASLQAQLQKQQEEQKIKTEQDLQAKLNQALTKQKKEESTQIGVAQPEKKPENVVQEKFNEVLSKKKEESNHVSQIRIFEAKPMSKIDILLEKVERIEKMLESLFTVKDEQI